MTEVIKPRKVALANPFIGAEEANSARDVIQSGWVSRGPKVKEFEDRFAEYVGAKYAVSAVNGTAALHLALIGAGIQEGDEVLIPDITFISTANVVLYERAIPVLVECDPYTYNIDLDDAKKKITDKTRAIIPVDMNGLPVDYKAMGKFAKEHDLKLIADSAESLGAEYKGQKIGSQAPVHIFSFFPNKNITTGEGGMIVTDDKDMAVYMEQVGNQGQDYRYHHIHLGYNYRLSNVPAAIGLEQLKKVDTIIAEKNRLAGVYDRELEGVPYLDIPFIPKYVTQHSWYMYAINLDESIDRDQVVKKLGESGIDTRLSFPPIHIQPYYQKTFGFTDESLPASMKAWQQLINIPIWPGLPEEDQAFVIQQLKAIIPECRR